ncbi:hypothetical protein ACHAWO_008823 [Cyclotella atomus]|uniref:Uncharacterized protein n=1 Tax=Cyclotella atomus TaxID=382360 RepID=A0ABD3QK98_9STRA
MKLLNASSLLLLLWQHHAASQPATLSDESAARNLATRKTLSSKAAKTGKSNKASKSDPEDPPVEYEVWASDQSNSVAGQTSAGVKGSFLWIWDSASIRGQIAGLQDATPLSCSPLKTTGPCDLLDIFPQDLTNEDGETLGSLSGFGRLHGVTKDPSNRYVAANIFAPAGGFVGVIDTMTKEAIALFRVTKNTGTSDGRSVHMSFWTADNKSIIVANLNGKMIERIDVTMDETGVIHDLKFNTDAGIYLGLGWSLTNKATAFSGKNAFGNPLIGSVVGTYQGGTLSCAHHLVKLLYFTIHLHYSLLIKWTDTGDLTPAGKLKETADRPNNVPICPIPSSNNNGYITLGGGGLFVLKLDTTPMKIIAEYGNGVVNGAGCGGVEANGSMFVNAGVSASGAGATQSTFTLYSFDDSEFDSSPTSPQENTPMPALVFKDSTNTNTLGNQDGPGETNESGQIPGTTTRRDSHGAAVTIDGSYVHAVDRIGNVMEVFDTVTKQRVNTYDLVSSDGKSGSSGPAGACLARSVLDDSNLTLNDPAPDLMEITPDGKYLMVAFRGPTPVTVNHSAQGSCPGVGIIEITEDGMAGKLVDVLRATNKVDTYVGATPGGVNYAGAERSDVHGAIVIAR